jgi:hypothetical protein
MQLLLLYNNSIHITLSLSGRLGKYQGLEFPSTFLVGETERIIKFLSFRLSLFDCPVDSLGKGEAVEGVVQALGRICP